LLIIWYFVFGIQLECPHIRGFCDGRYTTHQSGAMLLAFHNMINTFSCLALMCQQMGINFFLFLFAWNLNDSGKRSTSNGSSHQAPLLAGDNSDNSLAQQGGIYYKRVSSDNGSFEECSAMSLRDSTSAERQVNYDTDTESLDRVRQLSVA
jgi:hypothetical protein